MKYFNFSLTNFRSNSFRFLLFACISIFGIGAVHALQQDFISTAADAATAINVGSSRDLGISNTSGLPIIYSVTPAQVCSISAGTLTAVGAGICHFSAATAGNGIWAAASRDLNITVQQIAQSISINPIFPPGLLVSESADLLASVSSGLPITYSASPAGVCTVNADGLVTADGAGVCHVDIQQIGNVMYSAISATRNILINQKQQGITFTNIGGVPTSMLAGDAFAIDATVNSNLLPEFSTTTAQVCSVGPTGMVTGLSKGVCAITVSQPGNVIYASVSRNLNISVLQKTQSIGFDPAYGVPSSLLVTEKVLLGGNASSGLPVSYTTLLSACSVTSSGELTGLAKGTCALTISQGGDAIYAPVTLVRNIPVNQKSQSISFGTLPTVSVGSTSLLDVSASSGLPLSFVTYTTSVCTVANGSVTGVAPGTCFVIASQGGDTTYNSVQVSQAISVAPQTSSTTSSTSTSTSTSSSSSSSSSSTSVNSTTTTTQQVSANVQLSLGWNLIGNGYGAGFDVGTVFGDTNFVTSVWKWLADVSQWAFYTPSMDPQSLNDYASSKGYVLLSRIEPGEGYWVNSKLNAHTVLMPTSAALPSSYFGAQGSRPLMKGWSLIAIGDAQTPAAFNNALSLTPPTPSALPINLTSMWAWDTALSGWYFWAPSLVNTGALASYSTSKGYLDFAVIPNTPVGTLSPTTGFWVNKP